MGNTNGMAIWKKTGIEEWITLKLISKKQDGRSGMD
jgi:hypothetical protein